MPLLGLKTLKRGSPKYVTKFLFFFLQRVVRAAIKIERKTAPAAIGSAPAFALIDRIHLHRLAGLFLFNWVFTGFYRFFFCRRRVWLGARASIAVDFNLRRGWIHLHRLQWGFLSLSLSLSLSFPFLSRQTWKSSSALMFGWKTRLCKSCEEN